VQVKDNIKTDNKKTWRASVGLVHLAQEPVAGSCDTVMNLRVP
jgi:hypothetical protein